MAKWKVGADVAREYLTPQLSPGETLRSVGYFRTGPFWAMILLSNLFAFALKYWYAGITEQRVLFVKLTAWGKPDSAGQFAVPLSAVQLKGNSILVQLPDKPKPQKFDMMFGFKKLTGFDVDEFRAALPAG